MVTVAAGASSLDIAYSGIVGLKLKDLDLELSTGGQWPPIKAGGCGSLN